MWWRLALVLCVLAPMTAAADWQWIEEEHEGSPPPAERPSVDVGDVVALLAHLSGARQLSGLRREVGDTDADGAITVADLLALLAVSLGRIDALPVADACESDLACEWWGGPPMLVYDGGCYGGTSLGAPRPLRLRCVAWGDVAE